jgi:cobalt-zinc-cadmium efflux system protein
MGNNHHKVTNYNRAFALGTLLNIGFVLVEAGYGFSINSLALISDAGHNLSDVAGLLLAWSANSLAKKASTETRTYGYRKVTILASLLSTILLVVALGGIAWEAILRFKNPAPVKGISVVVVAAIGVIINTITALMFITGQKDLNIRSAFLHMAADALVSVGVVIAGIVIMVKDWYWVDPVTSLLIVVVVFIGTWGLLKDSINYSIDSVPNEISLSEVRAYLSSIETVISIHDLHIWPLSTNETALTVHIVVDNFSHSNEIIMVIQQHLHDHFNIKHSTIQAEKYGDENKCLLS